MITKLAGDGIQLEAEILGDKSNTPVIFEHGGGQTKHAWGKALQRVADNGFYGISLDLRGHGGSDWAPDKDYSMDRYVGDLVSVVSTLDKRPFLIGASLGGIACLIATGEKHVDAAGLVLVDITHKIEAVGASKIHDFMMGNPNGFASVEEAADAVAAYQPHRPRPRDVSGLRKNLREGEDGRLYWHWDPEMFGTGADPRDSTRYDRLCDAARNLTIPCLVIRGGLSEVVSKEGVKEFLELAPNSEYVDVADADHMVAGDKNDAFNEAVLDFLARHRDD